MKPANKPVNPCFSSGPCAKHPGYSIDLLKNAPLGRSHRSSLGKSKLSESIARTKKSLKYPMITGLVLFPHPIREPLKCLCGTFWAKEALM